MVNISKIIVISDIVVSAAVASVRCIFQKRFSTHRGQSDASGDAPWCAVTEIGEGDGAWDCQYQTVEECVPSVLAGNRGHCSPNPYAAGPTTVSVPATGPTSTTPSTAADRKLQKDAK